jgi:hypothetical protein
MRGKDKKEKYRKIKEKKLETSLSDLCGDHSKLLQCNQTADFVKYMDYCRSIEFEDRPNYDKLRDLFTKMFEKEGLSYDLMYDWND